MKLSVVIVSYNVKYYLEQCLDSLSRALRGIEAEVYVVDNHSKDGSVEYLSKRFPKVHLIASAHNLGFARANNLAISKSKAEYVLLLNPDTVVGEHTIQESLDFMDSHADAGSLGVCMLASSGVRARESRRGLPSPMVAFYKMTGLCARYPQSRRYGHYYMGFLPWDKPAKIEVVSGAYCMICKKAIDEVGSLDEDFFMYGEDIDLSYRILKGGYHNYYLPSRILHYKGESTQKSSFRYVHVFYEAMLIFFKKHYSGMSLLLSLPIKAAIYAKATVALIRMQIDRARKNLGFVSYDWKAPSYLFVGSEKMVGACQKLAQRKGLAAEFIVYPADGDAQNSETSLNSASLCQVQKPEASTSDSQVAAIEKLLQGYLPENGESWKTLHYIVFDVEQFSYESILEFFAAHPNPMCQMAFYHGRSGKLISDNEVLW